MIVFFFDPVNVISVSESVFCGLVWKDFTRCIIRFGLHMEFLSSRELLTYFVDFVPLYVCKGIIMYHQVWLHTHGVLSNRELLTEKRGSRVMRLRRRH